MSFYVYFNILYFTGSVIGPVANCSEPLDGCHCTDDKSVDEYISYFEEYQKSRYNDDKPCLYLKDWHCQR